MQRSARKGILVVGVDLLGKRKKFAVPLEKLQGFVAYSDCSALCSPVWLDYMHLTRKSVGVYNLGEKNPGLGDLETLFVQLQCRTDPRS